MSNNLHSIYQRSTGTPDFPPVGGGSTPSRLSLLLLVAEKNEKNVRKLVKNDYETISVNFQLFKHRFGKPPLSRELL